jgi:cytochrome P450
LLTLLFAGHETTASALSWALYWIYSLPEVQEKLLNELNGLTPNLDPSEIAQLPYLTAVCQETLRIYPIALTTFGRILKAPFSVMDYEFEPDTALIPVIYLTHRREDIALRKYIKTIAEGSMYTNFYILNTDVLTLMRSAISIRNPNALNQSVF